jgi:hypothetical protein
MNPPVDTSSFPTGLDIDYEGEEELELIKALTDDAWSFVRSYRWEPPIADLVLAFGVAPIVGVFLMRFEPGGNPSDAERWVVVGDLPSMHFETDDARTPVVALQLYCAIAQDWADNILEERDLSDSYPIPVAPTKEHAEMLKSRIETIRKDFIPLA